jgi:amidohydrolase
VAKLLAKRKDEIKGTIKFVFQPGEEGADGAAKMVAEGLMDNPKPDFSLAMHVWNTEPVGWYGLNPGPVMAGAEIFNIQITGKGGHGAVPQNTVDPVVAAAQIINALQTITSRNVSPLESAVVTVGTVDAGTAFNIIPQEATMTGTIRTFKSEVFQTVKTRFEDIVYNTARAMGCEAEIEMIKVTYPVENDPALTRIISKVVSEVDPKAEIDLSVQTMGSEDFSFMMQDTPGCFLLVGSGNPEKGLNYNHHHPKFNIDEACLPYAVAILTRSALEILTQ